MKGLITVSWEDVENNQVELKNLVHILKTYGMDHKFTSSSSFIEWQGDRETAEKLKMELMNKFPLYSVEWRSG